jgi:hypothetical protein
MADADLERELPEDEIERMIHLIDPVWGLRESSFVADGISAIYQVHVETTASVEEFYLKATPVPKDVDMQPRVNAEARLTECVRRHTDIPVPTVIGAVDDHDAVRTPFFLMEAMPGQKNDMDVLFDVYILWGGFGPVPVARRRRCIHESIAAGLLCLLDHVDESIDVHRSSTCGFSSCMA